MSQAAGAAARAGVYTRTTSEIITAAGSGAKRWRMPWHHDGSPITRPAKSWHQCPGALGRRGQRRLCQRPLGNLQAVELDWRPDPQGRAGDQGDFRRRQQGPAGGRLDAHPATGNGGSMSAKKRDFPLDRTFILAQRRVEGIWQNADPQARRSTGNPEHLSGEVPAWESRFAGLPAPMTHAFSSEASRELPCPL